MSVRVRGENHFYRIKSSDENLKSKSITISLGPTEMILTWYDHVFPTAGRAYNFLEGDIVVNPISRTGFSTGHRRSRRRQRRAVVKPVTKLWKYGMVPYVIEQHVGEKTRVSTFPKNKDVCTNWQHCVHPAGRNIQEADPAR